MIPNDPISTIYFVSLGCPKNTVDTARMVALARRQGLEVVEDPKAADVITVNTCGFIEAAKQESIDTVLEMAEHKHNGSCRSLVMAGCLSQRYPDQLAREMPEVDHFLGTADLGRLRKLIEAKRSHAFEDMPRLMVGRPEGMVEAKFERATVGTAHTGYMKISEGCNRPCAFCSIPIMRGRQRSRTIPSLVKEASALVAAGTKEIILVAQDTTAYGRDLWAGGERPTLDGLLRALVNIDGLTWIRLHYAYPSMVSEQLARTMAELPRVAAYVDMPIQHADDLVLRRMRRGYTGAIAAQAVSRLRAVMPDVAVRTTMLVGHPGETEDAHKRLIAFVQENEIDHLGAFTFSAEDGTAAATQPDQVPEDIACQRRDELMAAQRDVSRQRLARLVGQEVSVMVDGPNPESEFLLAARYAGQSPGIDGVVHLANANAARGDVVRARITDSADYDLVAHAEPGSPHFVDA